MGTGNDIRDQIQKVDAAHDQTLVAIRVVCEADPAHPLSGLFVLWAPLAPGKAGAANGAGSSGGSSPNAKILQIAAERDPLRGPFSVGFVDRRGYLQPARIDANPWTQIYSDGELRTHKLVPGRYRFCLIRHPNPGLAFELASALNSGESFQVDVERWGGADAWEGATREAIVQELDLTAVSDAAGADLVLKLPEPFEDDGAYWPKGSPLYKGLTLYEGMPHLCCKPVKEQVTRLQAHLGALRFPAGHQYRPYFADAQYEPDPKKRSAVASEQYYNGGLFDPRTAAAVARFQEHAHAGEAFGVVGDGAEQHRSVVNVASQEAEPVGSYKNAEHWAYLPHVPVTPFPGECRLEAYSPGLVDLCTGVAIQGWIKNLLRKPGPLLVGTTGMSGEQLMIREEAAVQLELWRLLHDLFECGQKSLPACHIFRSVSMVGVTGNGWLNNSIHKTGLAIDLACDAGFQKPMPGWTVRFEHRKRMPRSFPRLDAQKQYDDACKRLAAAQQTHAQDSLRLGQIPRFLWSPAAAEPGLTPEAAKARADKAELAAAAERKKPEPKGLLPLDEDWISALSKEVEARKARLDGAVADEQVTKNLFKMRWCIYAPSTVDHSSSASLAALQARLRPESALPMLEARLLKRFPEAARATAQAWVRWAMDEYARATDVFLDLSTTSPENLRARYFRDWLRPFLFDMQQVDGGGPTGWMVVPAYRSLLAVAIPDSGEAWSKGNFRALPDPKAIRGYVNLTDLAIRCGLYPIGTAGTNWKQRLVSYGAGGDPATFSAFVDFVVTAHDHPDSKDLSAVVNRGKAVAVTFPLSKIDTSALAGWRDVLKKLRYYPESAPPKKAPTPSRCFRSAGAELTFTLPVPELKADAERLFSALQGTFGSRPFRLTCADKDSRFATRLGGKVMKGSALATELKQELERLHQELEALKQPPPPATGKLAPQVARGAVPAVEKPDPAKEARRNQQALDKLLQKRKRSWLEVTLAPSFFTDAKETALEGFPFLPGDTVHAPGPGVARTLEWWHHQSRYAMQVPWGKLMEQVGYSAEVLMGSGVPADFGTGHYEGRRLGYTPPELESTDGGWGLSEPAGNVFIDDWK